MPRLYELLLGYYCCAFCFKGIDYNPCLYFNTQKITKRLSFFQFILFLFLCFIDVFFFVLWDGENKAKPKPKIKHWIDSKNSPSSNYTIAPNLQQSFVRQFHESSRNETSQTKIWVQSIFYFITSYDCTFSSSLYVFFFCFFFFVGVCLSHNIFRNFAHCVIKKK